MSLHFSPINKPLWVYQIRINQKNKLTSFCDKLPLKRNNSRLKTAVAPVTTPTNDYLYFTAAIKPLKASKNNIFRGLLSNFFRKAKTNEKDVETIVKFKVKYPQCSLIAFLKYL